MIDRQHDQVKDDESESSFDSAEEDIVSSFGYKQEMNKTISTISNFSIAFGCCSILSGLTPMWGDIMLMGGSIAVIWGWVLVSFFTFGVGLSLAEICSAYPVTGGLYIWVARLAPTEYVPLACWITGYCNWLGLTVAITSADLGLAQFLASVINIGNSSYNINVYWQYGIFLVIIFIHGLINSVSVKYNGFFNQTSLYWHIFGTLVIITVALILTPNKPSAEWVFTYFENDTGFSSNIYAFLLGLLQSQYTLSGFDAASQMSDETVDAARSAPKGILYAIGTAALVGLLFLLSVTFCVQDFQRQIVSDTATRPQMTQVFLDGVGYSWTIVFTVIIMGAMFFSGSALTLGSSRLCFAFARDGATPFSDYLSRINPTTKTPIYAVWANIIFAMVIGLLYIINTTAFNAIVSVNTISSSLSYFIPIALRLTVARNMKRGPFHLGKYSDMINFTSCCWIIFTSILFACPTKYPITALNMNYAGVIFVFVIGASVLYYEMRAKYWFTGPGNNIELPPDTYTSEDIYIINEHVQQQHHHQQVDPASGSKMLIDLDSSSLLTSRQDTLDE